MAREGIRNYEEIYNCQMVDMFNLTEVKVPCVHVKKGYVRFNMNALNLLDKTPFIEILVNPDEQYMLAVPCNQYDVYAVDWCRKEKATGRMIPKDVRSKNLAPKLYRLMGWDEELTYRVQCFRQEFENGKCLLYFDLPNYVPMISESVESKTGRIIKRSRPLYTTTQQSAFGPPLREMMDKLNRDYVGYYVVIRQDDNWLLSYEDYSYSDDDTPDTLADEEDPKQFLQRILRDGPLDRRTIEQLGKAAGIKMNRLYRIRQQAGVVIEQQPDKSSLWRLNPFLKKEQVNP